MLEMALNVTVDVIFYINRNYFHKMKEIFFYITAIKRSHWNWLLRETYNKSSFFTPEFLLRVSTEYYNFSKYMKY